MTRTSARDLIEHIEATVTTCRADLEATVDRLGAALELRELFYAAVDDTDWSLDAAVDAMTPDEVARARFAALTDRMSPKKEHRP